MHKAHGGRARDSLRVCREHIGNMPSARRSCTDSTNEGMEVEAEKGSTAGVPCTAQDHARVTNTGLCRRGDHVRPWTRHCPKR